MDQETVAVISLISNGVLALVTAAYVLLTGRISKAAEASAKTSAAVLAEMRRQRIESSRPIVIGRLHDITYDDTRSPIGPPVALVCNLTNIGSGPALNVRATLVIPVPVPWADTPLALDYIGVGLGFADTHALGSGPGTSVLTGSFRLSSAHDNVIGHRPEPFAPGGTYQAELTITYDNIHRESCSAAARFVVHMGGTFEPPPLGPLEQATPVEFSGPGSPLSETPS